MICRDNFLKTIFLSFFSILLLTTCDKDELDSLITIDTGIEVVSNSSSNILMRTKDGCSVTGFNLKKDYYTEKINEDLFIASTLSELEIMKEKYFDLPYLDTFSFEYFEENHLVFILQSHGGSSDLRNERIEKENDKYFFVVEFWWLSSNGIFGGLSSCLKIELFILQLPKK
jgi:hypothetical protein